MLEATPGPTSASIPGEEPPRRWLAPRGVRWGLSLGSVVVLLVVVAQWARSLSSYVHSIAGRYDFSTYYAAAFALRHNLHADIYSQAVLTQAGAAGQVMVQPPLDYTYPPLFALLLSPFTLLSFRVLSKLWLFGNAALWLGITVVLAREIGVLLRPVLALPLVAQRGTGNASASAADESAPKGLRPQSHAMRAGDGVAPGEGRGEAQSVRARGLLDEPLDEPLALMALALAAWLSLTFVPAKQTLLTGQINFLVLVPLALVPLLLRGGHERWAGAAIAVAAILKFTPAVLIVYLLLRRRWEAAATAGVVLAGLFVLSALAVGPGVTTASIGQALHVGTGDAGLGHNQALFAPLLLFVSLHTPGQPGAATLISRAALGLLALGLGIAIWRLPIAGVHRTPLRSGGQDTGDMEKTPLRDSGGQGTGDVEKTPRRDSGGMASARRGGGGRAGAQTAFTTGDAAAYGLALCGLLLLSPTAWVHHYVWVLPAAAIALGLGVAGVARAVGMMDVHRTPRRTIIPPGVHRRPRRGLAGAVVLLALVVLACASLGASLPYDWDTNPQPAVTHAGLLTWPLALLLRPVATLVLAGLLAILGSAARRGRGGPRHDSSARDTSV